MLARLRRAYPPPERSLVDEALERRRREPDERPTDLARIEREVTLGVASTTTSTSASPHAARDGGRAAPVRRGIDLDREPERARRALGDETWELVRPDRPAAAGPLARGLDSARRCAARRGAGGALTALQLHEARAVCGRSSTRSSAP